MGDLRGIYGEEGEEGEGGEGGLGRPKDAAEAVERMMRKRGFSRKINYGIIGSAYSSEKGSGAGSRRGSVVAETSLSPSGEIIVVGEGSRRGSLQEVGQQAIAGAKDGGSREEAIEVEEGGESDPDDYYNEEEMEMAGVDEVLGRIDSDADDGDEDMEDD